VAPVKVIVPVAGLPPVSVAGVTDTADSDGPGGVAALTERFAVRGTFWTAAVIWTIVAGAEAFVVIVKFTVLCPPGATTDAGSAATDGLLLNRSTVVGALSGSRVTVPCADAPSRTVEGATDRAEMAPSALTGPASRTAKADSTNDNASTTTRLTGCLQG